MSCDDLDRLRTESPHSSSSAWPPEAQQHLESCERCSQLQAMLDRPSQVDFPEALQNRIEAAILPGLRPVSPLPSALRVTVTLLLCSIIVIAAANWRLGVAGWHARSSLQASVDFSLLGIGALVLANLLAHQMMPGIPPRSCCLALPRGSRSSRCSRPMPCCSATSGNRTSRAGAFLLGNRRHLRSRFRAAVLACLAKRLFSGSGQPRRDGGTSGGACRRHGAGDLLPLSGSPPHFGLAYWSRGHIRTGGRRVGRHQKQNTAPPDLISSSHYCGIAPVSASSGKMSWVHWRWA